MLKIYFSESTRPVRRNAVRVGVVDLAVSKTGSANARGTPGAWASPEAVKNERTANILNTKPQQIKQWSRRNKNEADEHCGNRMVLDCNKNRAPEIFFGTSGLVSSTGEMSSSRPPNASRHITIEGEIFSSSWASHSPEQDYSRRNSHEECSRDTVIGKMDCSALRKHDVSDRDQ